MENTIISTPEIRVKEIELVNQIIDSCKTVDDTAIATKAVDLLEIKQPNEREVIYNMRQVICDITFDLFLKQHRSN